MNYTVTQFKSILKRADAVYISVRITPDAEVSMQITKAQAAALAQSNYEIRFSLTGNVIQIDYCGLEATGTKYGKQRKSSKPFCE